MKAAFYSRAGTYDSVRKKANPERSHCNAPGERPLIICTAS
jgi:hypothetical protein